MLIDTLDHGLLYPLGPTWTCVFQEAQKLADQSTNLAEGVYSLAGGPEHGGAAATVSVYDTRAQGRYESHRLMADIQIVLDGEEEFHVLPRPSEPADGSALTPEAPYDADKDIVFYREKPLAAARVRLRPGLFVLALPRDAHMPGLAVSTPGRVKKLVVKVPAAALVRPA